MPNVSNLVKTIQDIMRKDAGTYGDAQRLEQLGWMFFLKIFDDREQEIELLKDDYKSPLPKHLRWSQWAADEEGITGEALLDFVNNTLLPKLKALTGGADKIAGLIRMAFEDANNYMKNGTLMRQVINKINGIDFNASNDRHMFGDIYEKLLKDLQSAGNAGEFYTPRAVTQFIVDQVNPQLGETILDPACGTGGFLTCTIEHLRKQAKTAKQHQSIQDCFAGIEKKHLPHILCMTNMLLHGIDVPSNVKHDNTLSRPLRDWSPKERVDVIVTNPPFGGMEEDGIEANFPAEFRTRETADLFLVLLMKVLKPGGRAGLVLPDGTLFGEGVKTRIKEALLTDCDLHTIVRLPNGVFNPYTGIRTNLLFFTKGKPTTEVWYYEHPYPDGAKSYNKGKPIRIEEFEPEKKWWSKPDKKGRFSKRKENEYAWCVPIDEIKASNYNLDRKNPHSADEGPGDVDHLLPEYEKLLTQIAETRATLKQELHQALTATAGTTDVAYFVRPPDDLDLRFTYYLLSTLRLTELGKGIKPGLSRKEAYALPIALPPLAEQKRIVAKVDELMALCDRLEAQQAERETRHAALARASLARFADAPTPANLNFLFHKSYTIDPADLRKSILTLAVQGKLVHRINAEGTGLDVLKRAGVSAEPPDDAPAIPVQWAWARLGSIATRMDSGWSPACIPEPARKGSWGVLKTTAVQALRYQEMQNKALPPNLEPRPEHEVMDGDILFTRAGPMTRVGILCVARPTRNKLMISDKIIRFHLVAGIDPDFAALAMNAGHSSTVLKGLKSGMAASQVNISQSKLRSVPIPLPPLAEQRRIVEKVDQLMAMVDELEAQLATSHTTGKQLLEALVAELSSGD